MIIIFVMKIIWKFDYRSIFQILKPKPEVWNPWMSNSRLLKNQILKCRKTIRRIRKPQELKNQKRLKFEDCLSTFWYSVFWQVGIWHEGGEASIIIRREKWKARSNTNKNKEEPVQIMNVRSIQFFENLLSRFSRN